jgi:2-oxo-4-hydroxy-4-carboxy-5-ureidoimidazoline decarboxylase
MAAVVDGAPRDLKLALIRAHPGTAPAAHEDGRRPRLQEQAGAGLDQCSPAEFAAFQRPERRLQRPLRLPLHLRGEGRARGPISSTRRSRRVGQRSGDSEFDTAIAQIHRIARFRLADLL